MRPSSAFWMALSVAFALVASATAGIRVVSDLDDTAKITNVGDPLAAIVNGLFSTRSFVGMAEFYTALATSRGYQFAYLSGSPEVLRPRVKHFLAKGGFPEGELHLKGLFTGESTRDYKVRVLREVFALHPNDEFILIGDDTQADFDAYDELYRTYPDRILAIYIRRVKNRKLPPSAYPFLTAFDLARTEHRMGRMTVEEAAPTAKVILAEREVTRIIPRFSYCPTSPTFMMDPQIERWYEEIQTRIFAICDSREGG